MKRFPNSAFGRKIQYSEYAKSGMGAGPRHTPNTFKDRYDEYVGPTISSWWTVTDPDPFFAVNSGLVYTPSNQTIGNWISMNYTDPIYFDIYTKVTIVNPTGLLWLYFDLATTSSWKNGNAYLDLTWGQEPAKYVINGIARSDPAGVNDSTVIDSPGNSNVAFLRMSQIGGVLRLYYAVPGDSVWTEWDYTGSFGLPGPGTLSLMMTSNAAVTCTATVHYFRDNFRNPLF